MNGLRTGSPPVAKSSSCSGGAHKRCLLDSSSCLCRCHSVGAEVVEADALASEIIERELVTRFGRGSQSLAPIEAAKFVALMRERHPAQLQAWLNERAEWVVLRRVEALTGVVRAPSREQQSRSAFSSYATELAHEASIDKNAAVARPFGVLDRHYVVDKAWQTKTLRSMTAADIDFAIGDHERQELTHKLEAAFLRAVKKRLPNAQTIVGAVLQEADVVALRSPDLLELPA